ncbi:hypothetical protein ACTXO9_07290 [Brachybacterium tyrofermentans]|uniref:hypothetical protein n=1 Tax=Brachybacterium tyrofermentans TaxID=47848 RepID=UPI003FCF4116
MAPVTAHKLGPGTLVFGETGTEQEFGSHVTRCEIAPSWNEEDPIPTLSGDQYVDEGTFEGNITGEFLQEYSIDGLVHWTWQNTGKTLPFKFKPRNDAALEFSGMCVVRAVTVGGDVKTANTAEFEWRVLELPEILTGSGV